MKTYPRLVVTGMVLLGMVGAQHAWAANQGDEGNNSEGDTALTLTVPDMVKITKIDDLTFDYHSGEVSQKDNAASTIDDFDDVCIYSNMYTVGNTYKVTMTGDGGVGTDRFSVHCTSGDCDDAGIDQIDYSVFWTDASGGSGTEQSVGVEGGASAFVAGLSGWSNDLDCTGASNGGTNARVRVEFTKDAILNNKRSGTYEGVLTILITPEP